MLSTLLHMRERLYALPLLLLTFTSLCWAGNAIAGQLAVGEVAPFTLVLLRWVLVSAVLTPLYATEIRDHWPVIRPRLGRIALMAGLGFTAFNALFYAASHMTTGVNVGILQGSIPVFVLLGAFAFHGSRIGGIQVFGVALTIAGVILVATRGAPHLVLDLGFNSGDLLMILACLLYAFYTVALRDRPAMPGAAFFALMAPIATLTAVPFWIGEGLVQGFTAPTAEGWLIVIWVAIFPSCLAQLFFLRGVDLIGPGRAGIFVNLVPIFAALMSIVILGQEFAWFHAISLCLVIGGIWLAQRSA